jgi:hypothetical protein
MTPELHIDSIRLDLRGVSPEVARAAAGELGPMLQQAIADHLAGRTARSSAEVTKVRTAPLRIDACTDAPALRAAIARHVATAIAAQVPVRKA